MNAAHEKDYIGCENAESTDRFSSVALSCHREIVPEVILYIIMFIATINIILVRFINRLTLLYCCPFTVIALSRDSLHRETDNHNFAFY